MTDAGTQSPFSLKGRTALVTGASSGLGRHFAVTLAVHGARVVAAARRSDRLDALVEEIASAGGAALAIEMDVTDEADIVAAFDAAESAFGTVDLLVNNAGTAGVGGVLDITMADWRRVMAVNLDASFRIAQEAARRMVAAERGGAIVNIASVLGHKVRKGVGAYAVSKAGVIQMTRVLALELARHRIRVNAIAPGYVETEMNADYLASEPGRRMIGQLPQRRVGAEADLDGALLLLASDAGAYMTGEVVTVDGGHSLVVP